MLRKIKTLFNIISTKKDDIFVQKQNNTHKLIKYSKGVFNNSYLQDSISAIKLLPLPKNITSEAAEKYYLKLSKICRLFINEEFYIKATEMTTNELAEHFKILGFDKKLLEQNFNNKSLKILINFIS